MKQILWTGTFLVLFLFGCTSEQSSEQQVMPSSTAVYTATKPTPLMQAETVNTPTGTAVPAVTSQPSPTATATELPTNTPMPDTLPTVTIEQRCSLSEPIQVEQTDLAQGLLFIEGGQIDRRIRVLGNTGLQDPIWLYTYPDDNVSSIISPNRDWLGFKTNHEIDREQNMYSISMKVTNWAADQEFQAEFDNLTLSRFARTRWINDTQIIFPLANEGQLFRWLVWSPFSGEEETVSVELPDITERQRFLDYAYPNPDPLLELVVYPCEACDGAEYAVRKLQTGETVWQIDLGPDPAYVYRSPAYWAPNGQYFTVMGGKYLNQLLFFNREGEKIHEISLPPLDYPDTLTIFSWSWSPDSNYLAFFRLTGSEGNYENRLTYVDVGNGQLVDLCFHGKGDWPIWSPDSSMIAVSQLVESEQTARLISIINIHSGDVVQLDDAEGFNLMDWVPVVDER